MKVYTTACPRNCYSTCGLRVEVEDGRIRRIEPHPGNRATGEGVCLKGLSYLERVVLPRPDPDPAAAAVRRRIRAHLLGRGPGPHRRADRPLPADRRPAEHLLLRRQRHQGPAHRRGAGVLAALRRLHHHLRRPVLAGGAGGHPADPRRQPPQRAVGPGQRPPDRALGQERRRDQRPPDGPRRRGAGARRPADRHRPPPHRDRRAGRPGGPAAPRHRRRPGPGRGPDPDRAGLDRPGIHRPARAGLRRLPRPRAGLGSGAGRGRHRRARPVHRGPRRGHRDACIRSRSAPASACSATPTRARPCGRCWRCWR